MKVDKASRNNNKLIKDELFHTFNMGVNNSKHNKIPKYNLKEQDYD